MHLLRAQPGTIADGSEAVDLGQSSGDIVLLTAADTELACLAAARTGLGGTFPEVRLVNLMQLGHHLSVDTYVERIIARAKLVVVRLLGGVGYWPYGVEQVAGVARERGIKLAVIPGDDQPDAALHTYCTLGREACHTLWQYAIHGGVENARSLLAYAASLIGHAIEAAPPRPLLRAGLYWPGLDRPDLDAIRAQWQDGRATAGIVFYRALVQGGATAPVDALIEGLQAAGLNPLPVFVTSLKDPAATALLEQCFGQARPRVILNATGFALSRPGAARTPSPFDQADCPVLQVVFSGSSRAAWETGERGLAPRDLAMNVVLPEVDGRILSRAVSFKAEARYDPLCQVSIATYAPVDDRVRFVAALAAAWARLGATPAAERRIALVLANYPNRDGRIGNGVGLDTPASTVNLLNALATAGYRVAGAPADSQALMRAAQGLIRRPHAAIKTAGIPYALSDYAAAFAKLPSAVQEAVQARWGKPEADPFVVDGAFALPALRFGHVVVGVQPSRGYDVDPARSYHDPALVPPHAYLAFYAWLRETFAAQAVIHVGKHGNLEWLPGKSVALSEACFPEAALGALPHLYPFIVNDPGEGTQAKRRAQAVIIDHLTPPLTRADSYGPLKDLEALVDEYYEAAGIDPRRLTLLRGQILDLTRSIGLGHDCGIAESDDDESALAKLDNYLCELKEMQIRDGLHILGAAPTGDQLADLLVALVRVPRQAGDGGDASLTRALAADLGLEDLDPLSCPMGEEWSGPRPTVLSAIASAPWRSKGDTVERLELLARALIDGSARIDESWTRTRAVLDQVEGIVRPAVQHSAAAEIAGVLAGLDGRFVEPGPSGAPTRGRLDVLPTGRNFFSIDSRTVPTPAAWQLGWKSASLLVERHRQEQGEWPRSLVLSAWGTANMRTGGEDIAQALALMGVQPTWEVASRRVTGFEILPTRVLDRPRVDVTIRVSGFFRDAFPAQLDLLDSAARAVAALDEDDLVNPLAARVRDDSARLAAEGVVPDEARRRAGARVFGSMPGAYGAGLQALIDERGWESEADLARAYIAWGGYAYGGGAEGKPEHRLFERRLAHAEAVIHNQDNREHDLLDSDDY